VLDFSDNYLHICGIEPWRRYTYLSHLYKTYECNYLSPLQFSFHKLWWHHGPQTNTGQGGGKVFESHIKKHFRMWITWCALAYWPHSISCLDYETKNGGMDVYTKKINHDTQYLRWHWNTGHTRIRSARAHCKVKWTLLWGTVHRKQLITWCLIVAQDSSVGIVIHYGLDSPGIESWGGGGARLSAPIQPDQPWGPTSLLYNGYRVFHEGNVARAWRWPPTPL